MVQGKDIKIETDDSKKTTLTISQDFQKKKAEHHSGNEMIQDVKIEADDSKKTTLTIAQDFPKKHNDEAPSITSFIGTALSSAKTYIKGFLGV